MDIIFLNGLKIETLIGIFDWERQAKQTIILDIEMAFDISAAGISDAIEDTLNYKAVYDRLVEFVGNSEFFLIEKLAQEIALLLQSEFSINWLRLKLNKKGAVGVDLDVGVIIERGTR
ncbi:MAG: dihydroneopterin aldolase [Methylococcaceae bacterium]